MAFLLSIVLLYGGYVAGQERVSPNISPWSISSSSYYNANLDQTFFSYEVTTQPNGQVVGFQAGVPSCPELEVVGSPRRTNKYDVGGINFQQDIGRGKTWTYSLVVKGLVDSGEMSYAVPGLRWTRSNSKHIYSTGTITGPKCAQIPKIVCDPGQKYYHGECIGNTVRVALVSHSKYYTKLKWSTDYPGCSFSQVDTVSPYINFHGPICDTEFRIKLEVWGDNHQHEVCYTTITATDTTPPTFGALYGAEDLEVQCDDIPAPLHVVAKDSCDNDVRVIFSETEEINGYDYTVRRKWVAIDACDNKATHTQNIFVKDLEKPVFVGIPEDETVSCDIEVNPCVVVAIDNCDDVSVDHTEKVIEGTCVDTWKIIRTWIAEDESHNSITKHQTVEVVDDTDPVINGVPDDATVGCDQVPENVIATATDNCQEIVVVETAERTVPGTCVHNYGIFRDFTVVDECGNHVSKTWVVWVVDQERPRLSELTDRNTTVPCDNVGAPCVVEAVDNCAVYLEPLIPTIETIDEHCTGNYTLHYHWSAVDDCGNMAVADKYVLVIDDEPPQFTVKVPIDLKSSCTHVDAVRMHAVDNCGEATVNEEAEVTEETLSSYGALCPDQNYNVYRKWVATDECGFSVTATQTVTVTDVIPPVLVGVPPDMTLPCDSDYDFSKVQVQAIDNCDCVNVVQFMRAKKYGIICPDTFTIINRWWVSDCCGHESEHYQTVHVYDDVAPRFIGIPGSKYVSIENILSLPKPEVTAEDNCENFINVEENQHTVAGTCEHNYALIRSWYAVDECGNEQRSFQTIRCNDLTPPHFVNQNYAIDFECPIPVILPIIEVTDNVGGYLVNVVEDDVTVKGTCEDSYSVLRFVTATDPCGNTAQATYTVYVYDTTPPEWIDVPCQEDQYRIVDTKEAYSGLCVDNIRARDICAGDINVDFTEKTIPSSCSNEYMIAKKWVATDNCGNSVKVVRTVDVRDLTPPELDGVPADISIDCTDDYRELYTSPTAYDYGYDGQLEIVLSYSILSGQHCEFNYTALKCWTVHDCVGHSASACQTIEVRDNKIPTFTYVPVDSTVPCEDVPEAVTITAIAECGHAVVTMTETREAGTCTHEYSILRTYTAEDECDVVASHVQTVTVIDETPPKFDFVPEDQVLECGSYSRYVPSSCVDNCDYKLDVKRDKKKGQGTCEDEKVDIRLWYCEDDCGNSVTASQTIEYKDLEPPKFNYNPSDLSLPCQKYDVMPPIPGNVLARDDCDRDVEVNFQNFTKPGAYGFVSSENYRIWTATDNCGNNVEMQQTIIVYDDYPPSITIPESYTRICTDELVPPHFISIQDNCDTDPSVNAESNIWYKECHNRYQMEYCWTPYDKGGNYGQKKCMRISVDDSTPPVWGSLPDAYKKIPYTIPVVPDAIVATDDCDGEITVVWTEDIEKLKCPLEQRVVYTYTAEDVCGNAVTFVQTVNVYDNVDPPLAPKPPSKNISCPAEIPPPPVVVSNDPYSYEDYEVEFVEAEGEVNCQQERTLIRRWLVKDCAFNVNTWVQTISVVDVDKPVLPSMEDKTFECENDDYVLLEAWDECDQYVDVTFETHRFNETDCSYNVARKWVATDDCDNSVTETQTFYFQDLSPPMLYGSPNDATVDNHNVPGYYDLTCSDNCAVDDYIADFDETTISGTCPHEWDIIRKWSCFDACSNNVSHTQIIRVRDNEAPVFDYCPKDITVQLGQVPEYVTLKATDSQVYGEVDVSFNEQKELNYDESNLYQLFRVWTAEDDCGNRVQCHQTVTVIDTIPPIIPDVPRDMHLECDDVMLTDSWDEAYAAISKVLQDSIADVGTVTITPDVTGPFPKEITHGTCKTEYTVKRTWTATDHAGNSLSDTQVITVYDDKPPEWNKIVDPVIHENCSHDNGPEVSAHDNCDNANYLLINQHEKKEKGYCPYDYVVIRHWGVQDTCGNSATQTQSVYVTDTESPTFIEPEPEDIELNCTRYTSLPAPQDFNCLDNCLGEIPAVYSETKHQYTCQDSWLFIRSWSCADLCGHEVHRRQTITMVDDTPPEFVDEDYSSVEVECEGEPPVPEEPVVAEDDCAKYVDVSYKSVGFTIGYTDASYHQIWTAYDNCGNYNEKTRVVNVVDRTDPVIDLKPESETIDCDGWGSYVTPEPHCTDNCGAVTLVREVSTLPGTCEQEYEVEFKWICTDQHNRIDEHTMTMTIVDDEPPVVTVHDQKITVPCDAAPPRPPAAVFDNCADVTLVYTEVKNYPSYVLDNADHPLTLELDVDLGMFTAEYFFMPDLPYTTKRVNNQVACSMKCLMASVCFGYLYYESEFGTKHCRFYDSETACKVQEYGYITPGTKMNNVLNKYLTQVIPGSNVKWGFREQCEVIPLPIHLCENYELVRHWHSSDDCGNAVDKYHTIVVRDENPPVMSKVPDDLTLDCTNQEYNPITDSSVSDFESAEHGIRAPTAYDDCDPDVRVKETIDYTPGECLSNSVTIITWTAEDDCGLVTSASMTMTKMDDTPPELSYVPDDVDMECVKPFPDPPNVTATDDCNDVTVVLTKEHKHGTCNYMLVYKWVGTDECGNSASHQQILHVSDTLPPVFSDVPEDSTTSCADTYVHGVIDENCHEESCLHGVIAPTAEDLCGPLVLTEKMQTVHLTCENDIAYVFVWTAADECGNKIDSVMTLTKLDTEYPNITGIPDDETVECKSVWINPGIEAIDDCGPAALKFYETLEDSNCEATNILYIIYRSWVATDLCGHATYRYQTVVVKDIKDPTINVPDDVSIGCKDDIPAYQAVADDDCGIDHSYITSRTFTEAGTCEDEYDVITRYNAVDRCGNKFSKDHTVHVVDTEYPVFTGKPSDVEVPCDEIPDVASVQVQDDCVYPSPHFDETTDREGYCGSPYHIVRCWWVADNCGHRIDHCHTITVVDNVPPVFECAGASKCQHVEIECEVYPPLPPVTAHDNCYEHLQIDYTVSDTPGTCPHDHEEVRQWTTDDCASGYVTLVQTVTYYDLTPPVLEGYVDDVTAECPNEVPIPTVVANDNCDYVLSTDYTEDHTETYSACPGTYILARRWTATDLCGNSDYLVQSVTVVDTVAPVISVYAAHMEVECDKVSTAWPGDVTAEDDCDEDVNVKFQERKEDGTCEDSYKLIRTWSVEDCHGNSNSHVQTVTVSDTIPPYFVNAPPPDTTLSQEDLYTGAITLSDPFLITAEDNCADPSVKFEEVSIPLDYECDYMYYRVRSWSIHDDCGNKDQIQQTIDMVRTAEPALEQPDDITVECDAIPPPCDVQVIGEFDYAITVNFKEETIKGSCEYEYVLRRTWTANDCGYNTGVAIQNVQVVDSVAPVFTRYPEHTTLECGCDAISTPVEIDAVDNCDLGGDDVKASTSSEPGTCEESYLLIRRWEAYDLCGNYGFHEQSVQIDDTEPPIFCDDFCEDDFVDKYGDVEGNIECDRIPEVDSQNPLVVDDCDDEPVVLALKERNDVSDPDSCAQDQILVWSWSASDNCGNEDVCSRTINVVDTTPPFIVGGEHYCFPVNDYGPTNFGSYAVYKELSIELNDNCDDTDLTQRMLKCNGTQHDNDGKPYDEVYCVYFPQLKKLYVKMEANLNQQDYVGRYYYVWFSVSDQCGNNDIIKRTIWVPTDSFSYNDAVSRGHCPYGLGTDLLVPNLPISGDYVP